MFKGQVHFQPLYIHCWVVDSTAMYHLLQDLHMIVVLLSSENNRETARFQLCDKFPNVMEV